MGTITEVLEFIQAHTDIIGAALTVAGEAHENLALLNQQVTDLLAGGAATPEQIDQAHTLLVHQGEIVRSLRDSVVDLKDKLVAVPFVPEPPPMPEPEEPEIPSEDE